MKIGPYKLKNPIIAAPLAGISNQTFRQLMADFGVALSYTEMTSDKAIMYQNEKTLQMLEVAPREGLVSLQLFGEDEATLAAATKYVNTHSNAQIIDLNAGCPVPKVVNSNGGASLLKDPDKTHRLLKAMVEVSSKPITVKIRVGWDEETLTGVEMALAAEKAGVQAIAVHGRTRAQKYNGKASLPRIKAIKEAVHIPVIGNGDITTPEEAKQMFEATGVDAIMVGRGFLGNPWLATQIMDYLTTGTYQKEVSIPERFKMMHHHATLLESLKGPTVAVLELRSQLSFYVKELPHASDFRKGLMSLKSMPEIYQHLDLYQKSLPQ
jgi:nifR3 family TIM-barrel protein